MSVSDKMKEVERAERAHTEMPARMARADGRVNELREARRILLNAAASGDPGAIEKVRQADASIQEALRDRRTLNEINLRMNFAVRKAQSELARELAQEFRAQLPKVAAAMCAGLKQVSKAVAELDFEAIRTTTRFFTGETVAYQHVDQALRAEIGKAIVAEVSRIVADPDRPIDVSLATIEVVLDNLTTACEVNIEGQEERLERQLQQHELDLRERQEHTA